jgi:hypothetical protein
MFMGGQEKWHLSPGCVLVTQDSQIVEMYCSSFFLNFIILLYFEIFVDMNSEPVIFEFLVLRVMSGMKYIPSKCC